MSELSSEAQLLHNKITKGFKVYGALLWALFLIFAVLIPSLNGVSDDDVKKLASQSFGLLLVGYFLPYFVIWKLFDRKHRSSKIKKD
jgi:hypothetical protein